MIISKGVFFIILGIFSLVMGGVSFYRGYSSDAKRNPRVEDESHVEESKKEYMNGIWMLIFGIVIIILALIFSL